MSRTPLVLGVRALLIALLLLAPAAAQPQATAAVDLDATAPEAINGTGVIHLDVTVHVANHLCAQPIAFTVDLSATSAAGLPVAVEPSTLTFGFAREDALTGTSDTRSAAVVVGPAPANTTDTVTVTASEPRGGCSGFQADDDTAVVDLAWEPAPPPPGPERLAPGPGLALLLLAFSAAAQGGPKKRPPLS